VQAAALRATGTRTCVEVVVVLAAIHGGVSVEARQRPREDGDLRDPGGGDLRTAVHAVKLVN
jgi:hypothetical protein